MLYKKHPSNRKLYNESNTKNKLSEYIQKLELSKNNNPIKPSKSNLDSISFTLSSHPSRNIPVNLKGNYTTNINDLNAYNSNIEKLQLTKRKNVHIQDKISSVMSHIKKPNPYYSNASFIPFKRQCIENIKNKSKERRPKSKELKLLEMKIMLNHPLEMQRNNLNNNQPSLKSKEKTNRDLSGMGSITNHKRVQSLNDQKDIDNFSKELNSKCSYSITIDFKKNTQSRNTNRTNTNNNVNLLKRTFSGYSEMITTSSIMTTKIKPQIMFPSHI